MCTARKWGHMVAVPVAAFFDLSSLIVACSRSPEAASKDGGWCKLLSVMSRRVSVSWITVRRGQIGWMHTPKVRCTPRGESDIIDFV